MSDEIEIYASGGLIASVSSSFAPEREEIINIRSVNYRVIGRTFTIDHFDESGRKSVVCVLNVLRVEEPVRDIRVCAMLSEEK